MTFTSLAACKGSAPGGRTAWSAVDRATSTTRRDARECTTHSIVPRRLTNQTFQRLLPNRISINSLALSGRHPTHISTAPTTTTTIQGI